MVLKDIEMSAKAQSKAIRMFNKKDIIRIIQKERGRFFIQKDTGHFIILTECQKEKIVVILSPESRGKWCVVTQRHLHETDPRKEDNFQELSRLDQRLF